MQLQIVSTDKTPVRLALQGHSGSGKTYGALLLAYGLTGAYEKIALIDTDSAASLYSYFGPFHTLGIGAPYTPEKFMAAIELCERSGIEVIIIDSLSLEWTGEGGVLDSWKDAAPGTDPTPVLEKHCELLQAIQESNCHIICTLRSQEAYHYVKGSAGKEPVQKIGLEPLQTKDIHYSFHTVLMLDKHHRTSVLKDRTSFFEDIGNVLLTEEIAALYAKWCGTAKGRYLPPVIQQTINSCHSVKDLLELLLETEPDDVLTLQAFLRRKQELQAIGKEYNLSPHYLGRA